MKDEQHFNMNERKEPKFIQFGDGETVSGVLIAIEYAEVKGKRVARYILQSLEDQERFAFLGAAQINQKLRRNDVGHMVEVRCEGTDPNIKKNGNPMKLFRVRVSDTKVPEELLNQAIISDEDMGF